MAESRVRLYPTGTAYVPGIRAVERLVEPDVAERLVASGAFTLDGEPSADAIEDTWDLDEHPDFQQDPPTEPAPEADVTEGADSDG